MMIDKSRETEILEHTHDDIHHHLAWDINVNFGIYSYHHWDRDISIN